MADDEMDDGRFAPVGAIDGEVVESTERALLSVNAKPTDMVDASLIAMLTKAELDQMIATSRALPRSVALAQRATYELATMDMEAATSCRFILPRGKDSVTGKAKVIEGPSVGLARLVAGRWGNCRAESRPTDINRTEGYVEAEGIFHDLETNYAIKARVRRSIRGKPFKGQPGRLFNDDMINVTAMAASAIGFRNAVFGGVPEPIWRPAYNAAQAMIRGDIKSLSQRRDDLVIAFRERLNVKEADLYKALGVAGVADIGLDEIVIATGFFTALKNNEFTIEDLIKDAGPVSGAPAAAAAGKSMAAGNTAAPKPSEPPKPTPGAQPRPEGHKLERKKVEETPHDPKTGEVLEPNKSKPDDPFKGGPAPMGVRYNLSSDDRSDQGTLPVYQNGVRVGDSGTLAGVPIYDEHPPGTVVVEPKPEADEGFPGDKAPLQGTDWQAEFDAWRPAVDAAGDLAEVQALLTEFLEPGPDDTYRALARQVVFERALEIDAGAADPKFNPWAFDLWLDSGAKESVGAVFQAVMRKPPWGKLSEDEQARLIARVREIQGT